MSSTDDTDVKYTVFIRVPFPRGDFVDPPLINWNATKDHELWKTLSSTPKGGEIDWHALTERFDVALPFLLQQAAWLYARQLSQVREQLRRASKPSASASPTPPSVAGSTTVVGGQPMKRAGSGGGSRLILEPISQAAYGLPTGSRGPSSLSLRPRGSLELRNEGSTPSTPVPGRMPYSRTTSANTITQIPRASSTVQNTLSTSPKNQRRSIDSERTESRYMNETITKRSPQPSNLDSPSSSASSSSSEAPTTRSHAFLQRHRFSISKPKGKKPLQALSSADEDSDSDAPAFLPAPTTSKAAAPPTRDTGPTEGKTPLRPTAPAPPASTSSSSAALSQSHHSSGPSVSPPARTAHAFSSPTGQALAALSPRQRRVTQAGSESAGTPSMGSSFSDLDDASVTQSALEEALAREIKAGKGSIGVVGRVGGLWKHGMGGHGGQG